AGPGGLRGLELFGLLNRRIPWTHGVECGESGRLDASTVSTHAEGQSCAVSRRVLATEHTTTQVQICLRNLVHLQDTHLLTRIRAGPLDPAHCCQGHLNTMPGRCGGPTLFPNFLEKFFADRLEGRETSLRSSPQPPRSQGSWRRTGRSWPGRSRSRERVRPCPKDASRRWRRASSR